MVKLLDLPHDITLQIFGLFQSPTVIQDDGLYNSSQPEWDGLATLQACRLTCRALNELTSGMICPFFRGRLDNRTMERIEHLSRNPLIADGVRAVELNLAFRSKAFATDLRQYCEFVSAKVDSFSGTCDYETEFQDYEDDDQSAAAIEHRALLAAYHKFSIIQASWHQYAKSEFKPYGWHNINVDASYQQQLKKCFAEYGSRQRVEETIVANGAFVGAVASAISRFKHPIFLSFVDRVQQEPDEMPALADDKELLSIEMLKPHDWLDAEKEGIEAESHPARILVDLPVACYQMEAPLQGIHVGCFPLTRSFGALLPHGSVLDPSATWNLLASACRNLKSFQLGKTGLNRTPYREGRLANKDCEIIDGYFGAVCSGSQLTCIYLAMTPFRVTGSNRPGHSPESPDLYYRASLILRRLKSPHLTRVDISNVEISGSDLELVVSRLPQFRLKKITLCSIHLDEGSFAKAVEILRARKVDSKDCVTYFSRISGGEFGAPRGFDSSSTWMLGDDDERSAFWKRLDEHINPPLLQQVSAYVSGDGEVNPLLHKIDDLQQKIAITQ